MRNQYTVFTSRPGVRKPGSRAKVYSDSINCEHCGKLFEPNRDRTRFCSKPCFQASEKARSEVLRASKSEVQRSQPPPIDEPREDSFASRCQHWLAKCDRASQSNQIRGDRLPLVLAGHGISLTVSNGALVVKNGLTHHPQERSEQRFFPGKHHTPSRIVILGQNGIISIDAMCWLSSQGIPVAVLDFKGRELVTAISTVSADDHKVRIAQLLATALEPSLEISRSLIRQKLAESISNLSRWFDTPVGSAAQKQLLTHLEQLDSVATINDVRLLEATSASLYFKVWKDVPVKWDKASESKIPGDWNYFSGRESQASFGNRNANHPVNAILNYAFGLLETQVRIACTMFGLDSRISYLHSTQNDRENLIFDLMEPLRPMAENWVLGFVANTRFTKQDFTISMQGVCTLNPQLARLIASSGPLRSEVQESVCRFRDNLLTMASR